jgi:imidazolonepropionase
MRTLWRNARIATCDDQARVFESGALLTEGGVVEWVGDERALPSGLRPDRMIELAGRWVTPGLIDCHTHLVFAGQRASEFARRTAGSSYSDIAREGGGILSTVRATRAAGDEELLRQSLPRLDSLLQEGVTTVEIKSGYGLDYATEERMLRVARRLEGVRPVTVATSFLAAHALPPEFAGRPDDYIDAICNDWLPKLTRARPSPQPSPADGRGSGTPLPLAGGSGTPLPLAVGSGTPLPTAGGGRTPLPLAGEVASIDATASVRRVRGLIDCVDAFCENIAFSKAQCDRLYARAVSLGLPVRMHAEQLSNIGGSQLAASYGALSCDHLEFTTEEDAAALATAGSVAVLLPVAFYALAEKQLPPIAALRKQRVRMAVATDCNPGSAPGASLLLAMNMARRLFGLTGGEVLAGVTRHAAAALGLQSERGSIQAGHAADLAVWSIDSLDELGYWTGFNPCSMVVKQGEITLERAV